MRPRAFLMVMAATLVGLIPSTRAAASNNITIPSKTTSPQYIAGSVSSSKLTIDGAIAEVVSERSLGSPQGVHLLVRGPMQTIDVSVGPYLDSEVKKRLSEGSHVSVTGVMRLISGKNYLMAQEIVLGGQTLVLRNQNGFFGHKPSVNGQNTLRRTRNEQGGGVK